MNFLGKRTSKRDSDEVRQDKLTKTSKLKLKKPSEKREKTEKKKVNLPKIDSKFMMSFEEKFRDWKLAKKTSFVVGEIGRASCRERVS